MRLRDFFLQQLQKGFPHGASWLLDSLSHPRGFFPHEYSFRGAGLAIVRGDLTPRRGGEYYFEAFLIPCLLPLSSVVPRGEVDGIDLTGAILPI